MAQPRKIIGYKFVAAMKHNVIAMIIKRSVNVAVLPSLMLLEYDAMAVNINIIKNKTPVSVSNDTSVNPYAKINEPTISNT